jgi:hypothetical protein
LSQKLRAFFDSQWQLWRTRPWRFLFRLSVCGLALIVALGGLFAAIVFVQARINKEDFANQAAVTLRQVIGQDQVARLEKQVFSLGKRWRRIFPKPHGNVNPRLAQWLAMPMRSARPASYGERPLDLEPLMTSPPLPNREEGHWSRALAGKAWCWRTDIRPSLDYPDRVLHLFAFDMRRLKMVFVPGRAATNSDTLSSIPEADRAWVRIVFNGGFRRDFVSEIGQRKNGVTYYELHQDRGTLILPERGVQIQRWSAQCAAKYPRADLRQNLFPLLCEGLTNPQFDTFMARHNLDFPTRRDALGITADGNWLVFAIGLKTEPCDLALGLQYAGCLNAILLDQNGGNVFFEYVSQKDGQMVFRPYSPAYHLKNMDRVLTGSSRDFFYLMEPPDQKVASSDEHLAGPKPPPARF